MKAKRLSKCKNGSRETEIKKLVQTKFCKAIN